MSVGTQVLDSGLIQATIENLTVNGGRFIHPMSFSPHESSCQPNLLVYRSTGLTQQFDWPQLRSLRLKLWPSASGQITSGITFLKDFHHLALKEVTVEVHETAIVPVAKNSARHANLRSELEGTLLQFSNPRLVWNMAGPFLAKNSIWIEELRKHFPVLFQRGALTVVSSKGNPESFSILKITNYLSRLPPG